MTLKYFRTTLDTLCTVQQSIVDACTSVCMNVEKGRRCGKNSVCTFSTLTARIFLSFLIFFLSQHFNSVSFTDDEKKTQYNHSPFTQDKDAKLFA